VARCKALPAHEPVKVKIVAHETDISKWVVWFEFDGFLGYLDPLFVFAGAYGDPPAHECRRIAVTRIGLSPRLESLLALFQVSGHLPVVEKRDKELLPFARAVPQLVGPASALGGKVSLSQVAIHKPQHSMRHGELRVDRNRALEVRNGGLIALCVVGNRPRGIRPPGFQGRGGSLRAG
jgi:hypothetical protein